MIRRTVCGVLVGGALAVAGTGPVLAGGGGGGCYQDDRPAEEDVVYVLDNCFREDSVTVDSGETLTFEQRGDAPHTVTFTGDVDSGVIEEGTFAVRFREPGTYQYVCRLHRGMTGIIEVQGASLGGGAFEIVSATDPQVIADAEPASAVSPQEQVLRIRMDPITALLLASVGLSLGAGAVGAARLARR